MRVKRFSNQHYLIESELYLDSNLALGLQFNKKKNCTKCIKLELF